MSLTDSNLPLILQIFAAFLCSSMFSIILHTPLKLCKFAGLSGAAGWFVYSICLDLGLSVTVAPFFATIALAWLCRIFSFAIKEPITSFLLTAVFPIVPGAGIYYTGYYFFMDENNISAAKALETIKIAIAIALGIGIVLSLPKFLFTFVIHQTPAARE